MRALDPHLAAMDDLFTDWMVGIQFYLRKPVEITKGHITFCDSPWALTALTQGQFWSDRDFPRDYGDGEVVDCLSVDISNWDAPGILFGKPAKECTRPEIAQEVLAQIRLHPTAAAQLPDDVVHSWFLDPGVQWDAAAGRNTNADAAAGQHGRHLGEAADRADEDPEPVPRRRLRADQHRPRDDGGCQRVGRKAVNALLDASGSTAERAAMYTLYRSPALEAVKRSDALLYRAGLPNALDHPVN